MSQKKEPSKSSDVAPGSPLSDDQGWVNKNVPIIIGGGTFVVLVLLTLLMYSVSN